MLQNHMFLYFSLDFLQMRKFQAKYSAGLRIRSHPSLQSKQIGVVQADGTVTFVDEVIIRCL